MVLESTGKILVADDQADVLEAMRLLLKGAGYTAEVVSSPEQALIAASEGHHDLVMIDMNYARDTTSGAEGLALLDMLRACVPGVPVIVMTAWSTIELAVDAMRRGASDFITKPWENQRVLELVARLSGRHNELSVAQRVQRRLLPPPVMKLAGMDAECVFRPAGEVSGDMCDLIETSPSTAAFLLGDVSGKGTGAAMLMANLHGAVRSHLDMAGEPAMLITRVNRQFFLSTAPEHYATVFFGSYDSQTRNLRYVNAGHPPAVLLRATGETERLEATGLMVGAFECALFEENTLQMRDGDRIVIFSDGVSEARADEDDAWVVAYIRALGQARSKSLAQSLALAAVSNDDVTILDLRF